jgi:hypothetical protein
MGTMERTVTSYDVAISFVAADKTSALRIADGLRAYHLLVYHQQYDQAEALGLDLTLRLQGVYTAARFMVILMSPSYGTTPFTSLELEIAHQRQGDGRILVVTTDGNPSSRLSSTLARIDLSTTTLEEASLLIARRVLKDKFETPTLFVEDALSIQTISRSISPLSSQDIVSLFCQRMLNSNRGEFDCVAISAIRLLEDPQFHVALELVTDRLDKIGRKAKLSLWVLELDWPNSKKLVQPGDGETMDSLRSKFAQSIRHLRDLLPRVRDRIKVRLFKYCSLPTLSIIRVDDEYFFRPYRLGAKETAFHLFRASGDLDNRIVLTLKNVMQSLTAHSVWNDLN